MPVRSTLALLVALLTVVAHAAVAAAQVATPVGGGFDPTARFPAHLHRGTCQTPGEIAFPLAAAGYGLPLPLPSAATPEAVTATYVGGPANPAAVSVGRVEAPLDELLADGYLVDVHSGDDGGEEATRIVCGAIGGFRSGDDLVFGLEEANASAYSGTAWLHDNGDGTTTVTLFLASGLVPPQSAAPAPDAETGTATVADAEAVPDAAAPAAEVAQVAGLVIAGGAFATDQLLLQQGEPAALHVDNTDDRAYRLRVGDFVQATPIPGNGVTVIHFTTPTAATTTAYLLPAAGDEVLDTIVVVVAAPGFVAP